MICLNYLFVGKGIMLINKLTLVLLSGVLVACSSGSGSSNSAPSAQIIYVPTFNYQPGNKTAVMASIGGGNQIVAEIDTGSEMTVVDESAVGNNLLKTPQTITVTYGAGTNQVSGYLAYGVVKFTTANGETLSTSANAPIVVVTQGSVNQGGGNNAVLGMRMNNQVSSRLFLAYPYNQMMVLNRSESFIAFGKLSTTQLESFAQVNQSVIACQNSTIPNTAANSCWNTPESSVTYHYSLNGGGSGRSDYTTIFDSGEAIGNFYLESVPTWMDLDANNHITNQLSAVIHTNHGALPMPLNTPVMYRIPVTPPESGSPGAVNPGNQLFEAYQVLFDQVNGVIGFRNYSESW